MSEFEKLISDDNWKSFEEHMKDVDSLMEEDLKKYIGLREEYRKCLLQDQKIKSSIKRVEENDLLNAEKLIFSGNIAATDGTLSTYAMPTGLRCRIGVVATSYKNNTIEKMIYISEGDFVQHKTPNDYFEKIGSSKISHLLLQAVMSYKEREIALNRKEEWKMVHGHLVPFELIVPRLGPGIFDTCLGLAKKLVENKKIIGVVSSSTNFYLINAGSILNAGEYIHAYSVSHDLKDEISETVGNLDEGKKLNDFSEDYLKKIKVGVFRAGLKPYIFEAHEDVFDEAATIVIRDALNQSLRGFPLLIDFADSICKHLMSPDDFSRQMEHNLAKHGGYGNYGFDVPERLLRRR